MHITIHKSGALIFTIQVFNVRMHNCCSLQPKSVHSDNLRIAFGIHDSWDASYFIMKCLHLANGFVALHMKFRHSQFAILNAIKVHKNGSVASLFMFNHIMHSYTYLLIISYRIFTCLLSSMTIRRKQPFLSWKCYIFNWYTLMPIQWNSLRADLLT